MHRRDHRFSVSFPSDRTFLNPVNPLKAEPSDHVVRPRFHNGSDVFSTPSSTPKRPPHGLPDPTRWVSDRPVSSSTLLVSGLNNINTRRTPCRDTCCDVVGTPWSVLRAIECSREAILIFGNQGSCVLKRCYEFVRAFWA